MSEFDDLISEALGDFRTAEAATPGVMPARPRPEPPSSAAVGCVSARSACSVRW